MLDQQIREKRDEAHKRFLECKEIGNQIREKQGKGESVDDLEARYKLVFADGEAATKDMERFQAQQGRERSLEEQLRGFTVPVTAVPARATGAHHANADELAAADKRAGLNKVFQAYVRGGEQAAYATIRESFSHMGPTEQHMLLGTQGDLGGFLVPEDFRAEVIKDLAGLAVIRSIARVVPTSSSVLVFPSIKPNASDPDNYSSGFAGGWQPEGYVSGGTVPPQQTQPTFSQERIPVHSWQPAAVELSPELLADSAVPLDSLLAELIAETRAMDEDSAFINGNGVGKPLGLLSTATGLPTVASGNASLVTYNGLIDVFASLAAQYRQNATWLMNSLGYASVLKLSDTQARPIITPNTLPNTLWGRTIKFSEFLPDVGASAKPVIFGDFRFYVIADRQEMRLLRLTERFAPNVAFLPHARVGGQVVRKNAFRVLVISAS